MSEPHEIQETLVGDSPAAQDLQERIIASMQEFGFSGRDLFVMRLAIEEAVVNAIKHGNKRDPNKRVFVRCQVDPQRVWLQIEDEGDGFVLSDVPDPTAEENLDKPSGRGIRLMESFLTSIAYNDKGNCVTLVKHIE